MPSTYPYTQPPQPRNWPKIILIALGIIVLALVIIFGVLPFYFNTNTGNNNNSNPEGSVPLSNYDCSSDLYNCGNFTLQSEAQAVYDYCKGQGFGDAHRLDADLNGKACEGLN